MSDDFFDNDDDNQQQMQINDDHSNYQSSYYTNNQDMQESVVQESESLRPTQTMTIDQMKSQTQSQAVTKKKRGRKKKSEKLQDKLKEQFRQKSKEEEDDEFKRLERELHLGDEDDKENINQVLKDILNKEFGYDKLIQEDNIKGQQEDDNQNQNNNMENEDEDDEDDDEIQDKNKKNMQDLDDDDNENENNDIDQENLNRLQKLLDEALNNQDWQLNYGNQLNLPEDHRQRPFKVILDNPKYGKLYKLTDFYKPVNINIKQILDFFIKRKIGNLSLLRNVYQNQIPQEKVSLKEKYEQWKGNQWQQIDNNNLPEQLDVDEIEQLENQNLEQKNIKSKEELNIYVKKNKESKNDYFLHISNNIQKVGFINGDHEEFKKKQPNFKHDSSIFNPINQGEFFKNLKQKIIEENQYVYDNVKEIKIEYNNNSQDKNEIFPSPINSNFQGNLQKTPSFGGPINDNNNNQDIKQENKIEIEETNNNSSNNNNDDNDDKQSQNNNSNSKKSGDKIDEENEEEDDKNEGEDSDDFHNIFDQDDGEEDEDDLDEALDDEQSSRMKNENSKKGALQNSQNGEDNKQNGEAKPKKIEKPVYPAKPVVSDNNPNFITDFFNEEFSLNQKRKRRYQQIKDAKIFKFRQLNAVDQDIAKKEKILQNYDYYNLDIINQSWLKPKKFLNRIEIDLNDKQLFLEKVNGILNLDTKMFYDIQKAKEKIQEKIKEIRKVQDEDIDRINYNPNVVPGGQANSVIKSQSGISGTSKLTLNQEPSQVSVSQLFDQFRKQITSQLTIHHSQIANKFYYAHFKKEDAHYFRNYRRFNFPRHFKFKELKYYESLSNKLGVPNPQGSINVFLNPNQIQKSKRQSDFTFDLDIEQVESYKSFQKCNDISCKRGNFSLFEHVEQDPLILPSVGMSSKLQRYVYDSKLQEQLKVNVDPNKLMDPALLNKFKSYINEKLGEQGQVKFLEPKQSLPLIGQVYNDPSIVGVSVIENNLFVAPVFKQKAPQTDFLLVRSKNQKFDKEDNDKKDSNKMEAPEIYKYYLRKIDYVYLVGQIEPKQDVYKPFGRDRTRFASLALKAYVKQKLDSPEGIVDLNEVKEIFKDIEIQKIRSAIQKLDAIHDPKAKNIFQISKALRNDKEVKSRLQNLDITPEQMCQYEKSINQKNKLIDFGIKTLPTTQQIKSVLSKYILDFPDDLEGYAIAKIILEELNTTAWSLSNSFNENKGANMYLKGPGDPTNGHGGYSFMKKSQKTRNGKYDTSEKESKKPQDDKKSKKNTQDYRNLNADDAKKILQNLKVPQERIDKLQRWDCIKELKKKLIFLDEHKDEITEEERQILQENKKFFRPERLTGAQKQEKYQNEINKQFIFFIKNIENNNSCDTMKHDETHENFSLVKDIRYYMQKERKNWEEKKKILLQNSKNNNGEDISLMGDDDDDDDDDEFSDTNTGMGFQ